MLKTMKDIPLNVEVTCIDGQCGRSSHVIINLLHQAITHVVVENDNFRESKQRSLSADDRMDEYVVHLNSDKKRRWLFDV